MEQRELIETVVTVKTTEKSEAREIADKFIKRYKYKMNKHGKDIDHPFLSVENIEYVSAINEYWKNQEANKNEKGIISDEKIIKDGRDFCNDKQKEKDDYIEGISNFIGCLKFKRDFYFVSDIHGDLNMLLHALISSGAARFKKGQNSTIYYNIKTGRVCKKFDDLPEDKSFLNYVQIPNIEPNPDFKGKFVLGGDLIDKGTQSRECLCSVLRFINQTKTKGRKIDFNYLLGNYEIRFVENIVLGDKKRLINTVGKNSFLRKQLITAMENNDIKTALLLKNKNKTIAISHTAINSNIIRNIIINKYKLEQLFNKITTPNFNINTFIKNASSLSVKATLYNERLSKFFSDLNKFINFYLKVMDTEEFDRKIFRDIMNEDNKIDLMKIIFCNYNVQNVVADYQICGHIYKIGVNENVLSINPNGSNGYYEEENYSISVPTMLFRKEYEENFEIKQMKLERKTIMEQFYTKEVVDETEAPVKKKENKSTSFSEKLSSASKDLDETEKGLLLSR